MQNSERSAGRQRRKSVAAAAEQFGIARRLDVAADQERLDRSYAHLTAWQSRNTAIEAPDPPPPPPLTLFPLAAAGCNGCGDAVAEGRAFCRACDPRSA